MKLNMKMTLIACTILTIIGGFTRCNGDGLNDNGSSTVKNEGEPTYMTLNLSVPESYQLRADNDTSKESTLESIDVFIYNGSADYDYYISHSRFNNPVRNANGYTIQNIPTSTGDKRVFVLANFTETKAKELEYKNANRLNKDAYTLLISDLVANSKVIAMTSTKVESATFTSNVESNRVSSTLKRVIAKVTVQEDDNIDKTSVTGLGTLNNLKWTIDNYNNKSFLLQDADKKDPNWDTYTASDFSRWREADWADVKAARSNNLLYRQYAQENTSRDQREKELTRVLLRAQFTPAQALNKVGANWVYQTNYNTGTFWVVIVRKDLPEMAFFNNSTSASSFANETANASSPIEYTDGYCYWDLFLHNGNYDWGVLRNIYYKCVIKSILFLGRHTPDVSKPEEKPDIPTNISAEVTVQEWERVELGVDLEP
ncbi:MAG: Mfa1 family fimbria major subunit [Dysgonamonadaceae bacterium]|jgi:hypothetical protein|nr:Mfa1 family fimbria major subunit [Dysgonamonadaceae bacterium]